jgi:hypothetical protein
VKTELIEEGRRCYCPIDSIEAPKELGKKVFPVAAKRALKAIKEVRKFFALHLPGIPEL